jgi:DNA-binding response OmpR family regulator
MANICGFRVQGKGEKKIELYGLTVDLDSREVRKGGQLIELTVKEFELLIQLIHNKNVALRRSWLYERVWESEFTLGSMFIKGQENRGMINLCIFL